MRNSSKRYSGNEERIIPINPVPQTYVIPPPPKDVLVGHVIHCVLCVISLVLFVLTLFLPLFHLSQYNSSLYDNKDMVSSATLWRTKTTIEGVSSTSLNVKDYCWPVSRRMRVVEAFTCATVVGGLFGAIFGVLNVHAGGRKDWLITACTACAIITFVFVTIACSFIFSVYYWSFDDCGAGSSFHSRLYELSYGTGFIVTGWVLTFIAGLVVSNDATISVDARSIDSAIFFFLLFSFIGTLFACVSCPIPQWYYKNAVTQKATDVSLWKTTVDKFEWDLTSTAATEETWRRDYTCSKLRTMFIVASCFSIVGTAFNFVAMIWGLLLWQSLTTHFIQAFFFSIAGCVCNLVQFILETFIFYNTWCDEDYAYRKQKFVLGPGYALCVTSFCTMILSICFIFIAFFSIRKYFPSKLTRHPIREAKND